jgi:hypothetical protein
MERMLALVIERPSFNAVAREGFQYADSAQRYGGTEFIFVK